MKRRSFVQTGVAGAVGLALQPAGLRFLSPGQDHIQTWLNQFSKSLNCRRIWGPRLLSDTDLRMMESLDSYFSKRYFQRESKQVFVIENSAFSYLFYPVYLRNSSAGLCDILLPVFIRSSDKSWHHIGTFTGFQVEALAKAAGLLNGQEIASLLLPTAAGTTDGPVYTYKTRAGSVSISTVVKEKGNTDLRIYKAGELLLEERFPSAHCLNSGGV